MSKAAMFRLNRPMHPHMVAAAMMQAMAWWAPFREGAVMPGAMETAGLGFSMIKKCFLSKRG